jgi:tryptophan-specific transport protein
MQQNSAFRGVGGAAIVSGAAIGAGMLAMPVASAGMGFGWSLVCLVLTCFFMLRSGLFLLEVNLRFPPGASFDTVIGATLGEHWKRLNNAALVFVLYVLCYAFTSGGGSVLAGWLQASAGIAVSPRLAGLVFCIAHAIIIWRGTVAVARVATVVVAGMVFAYLASLWWLSVDLQPALLLDTRPAWGLFAFAALPLFLTSFGYHGNVPSLVKLYGSAPAASVRGITWGCVLALLAYLSWQAVVFGRIPRETLAAMEGSGGNVGALVTALGAADPARVLPLLGVFANLALVSSFLSGALGLFDWLADRLRIADDARGRALTATLALGPPALASLVWQHGFLAAIGFAGLLAALPALIVPALAARASRRIHRDALYRARGGQPLVFATVVFGVAVMLCHLLAMAGVLPVLNP